MQVPSFYTPYSLYTSSSSSIPLYSIPLYSTLPDSIKMRTSHSNPSSEAGSVSSQGNSPQIPQGPGHQSKKSLSSKADPNTALQESHDPSTFLITELDDWILNPV